MKRNQIRLVTISQRNVMTRYGGSRVLQKPISVFLYCFVLLAACEEPAPIVTSTLIVNAMIHNSSGSEPLPGAIRIDGGRVVEIGNFEALAGETVIDAGGLALAPGFIAMQGYYDSDVAEAIYEMTGLPEAPPGVENRGRIRTGYIADFVLFDPEPIEGELTLQDSAVIPVRVDKIWVGGVLVFDNGPAVVSDKQ